MFSKRARYLQLEKNSFATEMLIVAQIIRGKTASITQQLHEYHNMTRHPIKLNPLLQKSKEKIKPSSKRPRKAVIIEEAPESR
jgi:hypothetical protein